MRRILPALAAALLMSGCGYVGGPMTPLANVPSRVLDLTAVQRGSVIVAQFSEPKRTTEDIAIKKPLVPELRIGAGGSPFRAEEWAAHATACRSEAVEKGVARYVIPAAAWTGKEVTLAARVIGWNGKESAWSDPTVLLVVVPPEIPSGVAAAATASGVHLSWKGQGNRFRVLRGDGEAFNALAAVEHPEWTDPDTEFGKTYHYRVQTLVNIGSGREAESDPSATVSITPEDKFPPAVPGGLRVAVAPNSLEFVWERNAEADLAGYRVYRAAPGGDFQKVAEISAIPSYSDHGIERGKTYRYAVSAFDRAGNESPRSAPVEAALP